MPGYDALDTATLVSGCRIVRRAAWSGLLVTTK
jgi:hypothetical protein